MVEYVEFLTAQKTGTTYTEVEVLTPSRTGANTQMVIHKIEYMSNELDRKADTDRMKFYLTNKAYGTTEPTRFYDDQNILDCLQVRSDFVTSGLKEQEWPKIHEFRIPILVPRQKLYFGFVCNASATGYLRIHYTMRYVTQRQLYNALTD